MDGEYLTQQEGFSGMPQHMFSTYLLKYNSKQ